MYGWEMKDKKKKHHMGCFWKDRLKQIVEGEKGKRVESGRWGS